MGKAKQKQKRKTKRAIRQRLDALERAVADREAETAKAEKVDPSVIREGLIAKLAQGPQAWSKQKTRGDNRLLLELEAKFSKLHNSREAEQEREREKLKAARGPKKKVVQQKNIPAQEPTGETPKRFDDIAAAFSEANSGGFESDDYSNVKGMSEGELWAWQARHLPSE